MKLWVTLVLLTCSLLFVGFAQAQMTEGEKKAAARAAYAEGIDLQEKGRPAEALARFEAAQKLFDAPTHLLHIAQCQALTGKLVEASETYEVLVRKQLPPGSPEPFVQAQAQGRAELAKLRPRIPTMRVTLKPEPQSLQNLEIKMNERVMPAELVGIARPVNPGTYTLTATADGWATPAPVTVDVTEAEQKEVELTLAQAAQPTPAAPPVTPTPAVPPPYEQPSPPAASAKPGPSTTGLLFGVRGGLFFPSGDVDRNTPFEQYASAGGGAGIDFMARFAKLFLVGATFEVASLGEPDSSAFERDVRAQVATRSVYWGVLAGIIPNVDRISFVGDIGIGSRSITQTLKLSGRLTGESEESYEGLELTINAGISFPAGPLRIVPKAGFSFGQFTDRDCDQGAVTTRNCVEDLPTVNTTGHTMFNLSLALYYSLDLSKKPATSQVAAR